MSYLEKHNQLIHKEKLNVIKNKEIKKIEEEIKDRDIKNSWK